MFITAKSQENVYDMASPFALQKCSALNKKLSFKNLDRIFHFKNRISFNILKELVINCSMMPSKVLFEICPKILNIGRTLFLIFTIDEHYMLVSPFSEISDIFKK